MNDRRSHLILALPDRRGSDRGRVHRVPGQPGPQEADARPRPAGRPRGRPEGGAAEGPEAHVERRRPVGRDHAQPRRQARRERARDPQAGLEPDRDRARRREEPAGGRGDHRQDRAAPVLRPRGRPRSPPSITRPGHPGRDDEPLRAARAVRPGRRSANPEALVRLQRRSTKQRRRPGRDEGASRSRSTAASCRRATRALRRPDEDDGHHVRPARRRRARASTAQTPPTDVLLPLQVRPAGDPGDDGQRPRSSRARRPDFDPSRRADRADAVHGQGREEVPRRSPAIESQRGRLRRACSGRTSTSTSRSCSTARSRRSRRSTSTNLPDGISGNSAQITGIGSIRRGEGSRSCSRRAPCRSTSSSSSAPTSRRRSARTR